MTTYVDVDVAEIETLRQEITTRIGLMNAVIALELAAVGTGLTILNESAHVLAGLAATSSLLWLLWMDQSMCTYKIAAYLSVEMAPRLQDLAGRRLLVWESFLRNVEAGGRRSVEALFPGSPLSTPGIVRMIRADWYVPLLFGSAPPLLLGAYVRASLDEMSALVIGLVCFVGALLWLVVVTRFVDFVRNTKIIDKAIIAVDARADVNG
jgi:hypothetical protein